MTISTHFSHIFFFHFSPSKTLFLCGQEIQMQQKCFVCVFFLNLTFKLVLSWKHFILRYNEVIMVQKLSFIICFYCHDNQSWLMTIMRLSMTEIFYVTFLSWTCWQHDCPNFKDKCALFFYVIFSYEKSCNN